MFVKVDLTVEGYDNYLINTDFVSQLYNDVKSGQFVVEISKCNEVTNLEITEDSFHRLVGFLFKDKKNAQKPTNIILSTNTRRYRSKYNNYKNDNTETKE